MGIDVDSPVQFGLEPLQMLEPLIMLDVDMEALVQLLEPPKLDTLDTLEVLGADIEVSVQLEPLLNTLQGLDALQKLEALVQLVEPPKFDILEVFGADVEA